MRDELRAHVGHGLGVHHEVGLHLDCELRGDELVERDLHLRLAEPQVKTALDRLIAAKLAIKVKPDLVMHARTIDDVRTRLLAFLDQHGTIDAQQWKDLTGASRKFTIPLAEYFDAEKLTLRVGDVRRKR